MNVTNIKNGKQAQHVSHIHININYFAGAFNLQSAFGHQFIDFFSHLPKPV